MGLVSGCWWASSLSPAPRFCTPKTPNPSLSLIDLAKINVLSNRNMHHKRLHTSQKVRFMAYVKFASIFTFSREPATGNPETSDARVRILVILEIRGQLSSVLVRSIRHGSSWPLSCSGMPSFGLPRQVVRLGVTACYA